jgi:DNA-binding transcriptional regulator YhcF (GntR family)
MTSAAHGQPSLGEQAYEELRSAIVMQRLASGTPLVEADVTTSLGVSRTPVREALRRLELEGYLERDDSSRLFVRRMTVEQLDQAFLVRELLEAFAARLAAERIADAEIERLETLLAADVGALEAGDVEQLARLSKSTASSWRPRATGRCRRFCARCADASSASRRSPSGARTTRKHSSTSTGCSSGCSRTATARPPSASSAVTCGARATCSRRASAPPRTGT